MDGGLAAEVDALLDAPFDRYTDDELLDVWKRLETVSRKLAAVDHRIVSQVASRHLDHRHGAKSMVSFARDVLRVSANEAKARVSGADAAGPRVSLTGEPMPPVFEHVAAAQAAGEISPAHARIVVRTVDKLPGAVQEVDGEWAETFLVEQAKIFDPDTLGTIAHRLLDTLDPDGTFDDAERRQRDRGIGLRVRGDGSSHLDAELTAECTEHVRTMFDTLARPRPAEDGTPDGRTPTQRRHDALLDALIAAERAQLLPNAGGVSLTVILTATASDWINSTGMVTTGHGVSIATEEAKFWAGDARIVGVVFNGARAVTEYSSTHRIFTECQRLAMIARDGGCSFPGCDAPAQQCQANHMLRWEHGGPTTVDNGALMCAFHHREHERMGWTGTMINGIPHWIPPAFLDPSQVPRRNHLHQPELARQ